MYPYTFLQQMSALQADKHLSPAPKPYTDLHLGCEIWTVGSKSIVQAETNRGLITLVSGDQVLVFTSEGEYSHATSVRIVRNSLKNTNPDHKVGLTASQFKTVRGFFRS